MKYLRNSIEHEHFVKSGCIQSFSGPYFIAFGSKKLPMRTLFTQSKYTHD